MESARACDGTDCEFEFWQCRINVISHVHRDYDCSGPFGVDFQGHAWSDYKSMFDLDFLGHVTWLLTVFELIPPQNLKVSFRNIIICFENEKSDLGVATTLWVETIAEIFWVEKGNMIWGGCSSIKPHLPALAPGVTNDLEIRRPSRGDGERPWIFSSDAHFIWITISSEIN